VFLFCVIGFLFSVVDLQPAHQANAIGLEILCDDPGWFPEDFGLKDHTVFRHDGFYYIASIYLGEKSWEDRFAYARSMDLCNWESLGGILKDRPEYGWEGFRIWAPFVMEEDGFYYMYYTGVTEDITQSIMLATSKNPADPESWQRQGMIFQPSHIGMVWPGEGSWSDCRDPMVKRWGSHYYLYYTGKDKDGGIVGLATAESPEGPWRDWGAILTVPGTMLESPMVIFHEGWYYLVYNQTSAGERLRVGPTPSGPWSESRPLHPGWAHEIWMSMNGNWMTSYLTTYDISIQPLTWDETFSPAWPFIGEQVHHLWLPLIMNRNM
jgi:beta-xylosidase